MPFRIQQQWIRVLAWSVAILVMTGCASSNRLDDPAPWPDEDRLREAIYAFLPDAQLRSERERMDLRYLSGRLRAALVQPGLEERYLVHLPVRDRSIRSVRVEQVHEADTVRYLQGVDVVPDARSAQGRRVVRAITSSMTETVARRVSDPRRAELDAYCGAGVRTLLLVGPLRPLPGEVACDGLVVVQVTLAAFARITNIAPDAVEGWLAARSGRVRLTDPLEIFISRSAGQAGQAVQADVVAGYVSGRHPIDASDLVLVIAPLFDGQLQAGARGVRSDAFGQAAAATYAVAERTSEIARLTNVPHRTIGFLFVPASTEWQQVLRAYLEQPLWSLDRTAHILLPGFSEEVADGLRERLASREISVEALPVPTTGDERWLLADDALREQIEEAGRTPPETIRRVAQRRMPQLLQETRVLADSLLTRVLEWGTPTGTLPSSLSATRSD